MKPKEAFEILRDTPIDIRSVREDDIHSLYATAQNMALDALERQMWIPCSERLPEEPEENPMFEGAKVELYLVSAGKGFYPFRAFWNGEDFTDGLGEVYVEAWMPLPPAYKEGE